MCGATPDTRPALVLTRTLIPRMRFGPRPVKLPIANVLMFRWSGHAAVSPLKTPRKQIYSPQLRRFKERLPRQPPTLTKTGRSRISRANCPRCPGSTRGRLVWAVNGPFSGRPASPDLISIQQAELPGQRRTTREADLSTQQTGAQAPSRLPRPSRHRRRPQGSRRPPCAWSQASERLSRIFRRFHSWIG